jgi:CRP-like cAMP-binding protein
MSIDAASGQADEQQQSLSTAAARNLATTTKTVPQMQNITSRWLLRMLPWVNVSGGTYRVNRRLSYELGGSGKVSFAQTADTVTVIPPSLRQVPLLAGLADDALLEALAGRFTQREVEAGAVIAGAGQPENEFLLVAHGKVNKNGSGRYGGETLLGVLAGGDHLGIAGLLDENATWDFTATAATATTVLALPRQAFAEVAANSPDLQAALAEFRERAAASQNKHGEAAIEIASGHSGEPTLPVTFADYELAPREYELSVAQTVLRVHTRVADLYNQPMNQVEQQLRLTIEELRERQEHELVNNAEFGLLHNVDYRQRLHAPGPPTPDDLDDLLSLRRARGAGCTRAACRCSAARCRPGAACRSSRATRSPSPTAGSPRSWPCAPARTTRASSA